MEGGIGAGGLGCGAEAEIDDDFGMGGDDVGAAAAGDESGVEGESAVGAGERADGEDLVGGFDDGGGAALEVESGVGGVAVDAEGVAGDSFARGFAGAIGAGGGFEDEDGAWRREPGGG